MKLKPSSKAWIHEHINDEFVKRAQKEGYRARAAYKLTEIDDKDKLIKPGMIIVDLGATPGSWSQVVVQRLKGQGRVIALDLLEMQPINGVEFIQGDFREESVLKLLEQSLNNKQVDLVIADMAPNMSGIADVDQAGAAYLTELALDFSRDWLKPNGNFLVKVFVGAGFDEILLNMRKMFDKVVTRKPKASRGRSSEVYLLGLGRKAIVA
ncbi:MAG: 23S rRNA (uridine(2552)-2'-O)-methyltransferase RlmE [Methylophilaceae bacterium]|jgi:23S rRNA (uridine2552-2'-O)-methyltransferase|nr:23S rRNA (uridine(2552)-2'-O)-methyltransferase RlmE [Methylophilales bacterium]